MSNNSQITQLIEREFNLNENISYLNHAAVSPWPTRTTLAVQAFAEENNTLGSLNYLEWMENEHELREQLAQLINAASTNEIALLKNTSEALSVVAHGTNWNSGDNVVISDQEFPSNRIVWQSLKNKGVEVKLIDLNSESSPELALIKQIDSHTRILSVSSVQYSTGLKLNLAVLGNACKQHGCLFCVDAIQSVAAVEIDVQQCEIDFLMADGHKWMLAPEGVAVFYCRQSRIQQLELHQFGWRMIENPHDFQQKDWKSAKNARRFECGSPNMLGIHALRASLSLILEVGISEVQNKLLSNVHFLFNLLESIPDIQIITDTSDNRYAGIVTFKSKTKDHELLYQYLMQNKVMCAHRAGGIRFSPHFYTSKNSMQSAVTILESF
ncbi:Cysteine desulfurase [hydrothermal vent metagenome]|uniref:Cysteine desulfurase n=1 Tax=hydrothermal vent metagenome TaxID=652676 RepID=A0A3B0ZTV2_9ZZZZ